MPDLTVEQAFQIAKRHHAAGQLPQAENLYRQILAQQPNHTRALHFLGVIAYQVGRNDLAVDLIRQSIALDPNCPEALNNLAIALKDAGQIDDAIAAYRQAIALKPGYAEAHNNLAIALKDAGQLDQAIAASRQALALNPNFPDAHGNLGNALKDKGQLDEAIAAYREAIFFKPNSPETYSNLGIALTCNGQLDEAIAAFHHAIALNPNLAAAYINLGHALKNNRQLDEAIAAYRQAIALNPGHPEAWNNLGIALKDMGDIDDAITACRQALTLKPDYTDAHSNLVFALHYHPASDAQTIAREHRDWNRQHAEPLTKHILPHANDRNPDRRLKIGYVSPDFRDHVVGRNLLPLFRQHDRQSFDITCYAQVHRPDSMTGEFQQNADCWRDTVGLSDEQVANQIREDRIDILIDLTLHMAYNRLLVFARKPAPVQATFAGYPAGTGLEAIDYRLSDPYLDPPGMDESVYSEQTIRLADSFWCYDPLDCREIPVNPLPALESGIVTFGCLNNFCKVNRPLLKVWAQVLRKVENSRLILMAHPGSHRQRALDSLHHEGIEPNRVEFVPHRQRRQYLESYHRIDLGLDSFPYNGHTTSLDSFWMGVPVITLVGQTAVARAGWCQLGNLGLMELAGQTPEQFVRIAVELAGDLPRLRELRRALRQRMEASPLMDAPRFARNIEAAYRQMWHTWCAKGV